MNPNGVYVVSLGSSRLTDLAGIAVANATVGTNGDADLLHAVLRGVRPDLGFDILSRLAKLDSPD
jgi:hypothetical protein